MAATVKNKQCLTDTFYVNGMHCAACEILIEKKLIKIDTVESVDAHLSNNAVDVEHQKGDSISVAYLNKLFAADGYTFSSNTVKSKSNPLAVIPIALAIIIVFLLLNKTGFTSLVSVDSSSSLPIFFLFGLLAGFSSCAALVGGIILSVSKQWSQRQYEPHLLFNAGRFIGYSIFGALLGLLGSYFRLSPTFTAVLVISISIIMVILGLQMLGVKALARFQFRLPKSITSSVADESNFKGRLAPFIMGALTFFLPCGFTITAQALALSSGSPLTGGLIMGLFALGTLPGLLAIGFTSVKLYQNPKLSAQFSMIAGILVLFFALFNIKAQLNILGFTGFQNQTVASSDLPPIVNGFQIVKMSASSTGYTPSNLKIRAGIPVRWEITNQGVSGCTNAILAPQLFKGPLNINSFAPTTKEFTVATPGIYRFSCWMGMISGTIEVTN